MAVGWAEAGGSYGLDGHKYVQIVDNFRKNGISIIEPLSEEFLTDIIRYSIKKYHNEEPIMSDNQYDIIKEFTEKKYPDHPVFTEIGAEVERNKAKLPYEMGSMDKIKPDTNALQNWSNKYKGPYVLSCKLSSSTFNVTLYPAFTNANIIAHLSS